MNITGKFLKVWKVQEKNGYKFLDLGDSRKNKDGEYENCTWFGCMCLSDANNVSISEGDKVEITSGVVFLEKYNDKWSPKVKIFGLNVMNTEGQKPHATPIRTPSIEEFVDDIPF